MGTVHTGTGYKARGPRYGSVNGRSPFLIQDVWQPSSKKVLWSASRNVARNWNIHTGANLVKKLREHIEEQEKSTPGLNTVSSPQGAEPRQ